MKAVIFDRYPHDVEGIKQRQPNTVVSGSLVHGSRVVSALLAHGSYDRYFAVSRRNEPVAGSGAASGRAIEPLTADKVRGLSDADDFVFMTNGPVLTSTALLRRRLRLDGPVAGTLHAVGVDEGALFRMLLDGDVHCHDLLICSTDAGRYAWQRTVDAVVATLHERLQVRLALPLRCEVIPLGLDTEAFAPEDRRPSARQQLGLRPQDVALLYFGRFSSLYKCDLFPLLLVLSRLSVDASRRVHLFLAGDDAAERIAGMLEQAAAELAIGERVHVRADPTPEDRRDLLAAADIFVSPSDNLQETFGITLAEAMATGVPVVASDWNGYKNVVSHGSNGFLVPTVMPRFDDNLAILDPWMYPLSGVEVLAQTTSFDVEAMAHFVQQLVQRDDLRRSMGETARADARRTFDWKVVVARYEDTWASLSADARRSRGTRPAAPATGVLSSPDYQHVFAHYPTAFLDDEDLLACNGALAHDLSSGMWHTQLAGPSGPFSSATFTGIVEALDNDRVLSLRRLVEAVVQDESAKAVVKAHIARLLKYSVLRIHGNTKYGVPRA